MTLHTESDLRDELARMVETNGAEQTAEELKIGRQYLCDVIQGKYRISRKLAKRLGFRARVVFEKGDK